MCRCYQQERESRESTNRRLLSRVRVKQAIRSLLQLAGSRLQLGGCRLQRSLFGSLGFRARLQIAGPSLRDSRATVVVGGRPAAVLIADER